MNKRFWMKKIVGFVICALLLAALVGWVVMSLWNGVLTQVLNVPLISFWQALGILVLSKILFGGFSGKSWGGGRGHYWKKEMQEKWHNMTPEERDKLKEEWRNRCSMWRGRSGGNSDTNA